MEPFFFLHADLDQVVASFARTTDSSDSLVTTKLTIFGKDSTDQTVVVSINNYRIQFYVSFRNAALAKFCFRTIYENNTDKLVVAANDCTGYRGMLLEKSHQVANADDYSDTTLSNVIRFKVRKKRDVKKLIERIDNAVYQYYSNEGRCEEYFSAANYYESNLDVITLATRSLGLDACRWCYLNTDLCKKISDPHFIGRHYSFYDNTGSVPNTLFISSSSKDESIIANVKPLPELPPRVKILSFDIECLSGDVESMPDMEKDPVIQISSVVSPDALGVCCKSTREGDEANSEDPSTGQRYLFTLGGTCGAITGVSVYAFSKEYDMLTAFVDHLHEQDPDILTGYNINNFDLPYLFKRMEVNGVNAIIGRGRTLATCTKRAQAQDVGRKYASFMPKKYDTNVSGRVCFDMYTHLRKEVVLRSYTLNSVSSHFLNQKKDDVSYKEIPTLFNGDDESRARLGHYCVKDAQLVLELVFKTQTFVHAFERCKVFRTMLQYLVDRGQQMKFYSMLLAWCSDQKILINDVTTLRRLENERRASVEYEITKFNAARNKRKRAATQECGKKPRRSDATTAAIEVYQTCSGGTTTSTADEQQPSEVAPSTTTDGGGKSKRTGYDGATVLDPIAGMYNTPVLCLDYASLYPSIMIGYNLCFTTLVLDLRHGRDLLESGLAEQSPIGHYFLKRSVKKGILPSILEMLLEERTDVRKRMKNTPTESIEYSLLDGQQSALKIAANSIYGAIGCDKSILNFVEIPSSVTAYGRQLILLTKEHVERNYSGTQVVYGDTDSVMVNLTSWDSKKQRVWECEPIGNEMAASVTETIHRTPIRLQFETVYRPFLLCTKKRYAAGVYNDLEKMKLVKEEDPGEEPPPSNIKYKGLQVVRRDNCTFATRLMRFVLESLMYDKSLEQITDGLREELSHLFSGRFDMEELIISKELKRQKDAGEKLSSQAHERLVARMRLRDPNSTPSVGDRVPYVILAGHSQLCDRAEDPSYVMEKALVSKIDIMYYAENVTKQIADLLSVVLKGQEDMSLEEIKDLFWPENAPPRDTDKRKKSHWSRKAAVGSRRITDFFC